MQLRGCEHWAALKREWAGQPIRVHHMIARIKGTRLVILDCIPYNKNLNIIISAPTSLFAYFIISAWHASSSCSFSRVCGSIARAEPPRRRWRSVAFYPYSMRTPIAHHLLCRSLFSILLMNCNNTWASFRVNLVVIFSTSTGYQRARHFEAQGPSSQMVRRKQHFLTPCSLRP